MIKISESEQEIMKVLWQSNTEMSAFEIRQHLEKEWERTTVLTLIRRLVEKGAIEQKKKDIYYYRPQIAENDFVKEETQNFVKRVYKGSSKNLIASLLQSGDMNAEDIEDLKNFFNSRQN